MIREMVVFRCYLGLAEGNVLHGRSRSCRSRLCQIWWMLNSWVFPHVDGSFNRKERPFLWFHAFSLKVPKYRDCHVSISGYTPISDEPKTKQFCGIPHFAGSTNEDAEAGRSQGNIWGFSIPQRTGSPRIPSKKISIYILQYLRRCYNLEFLLLFSSSTSPKGLAMGHPGVS